MNLISIFDTSQQILDYFHIYILKKCLPSLNLVFVCLLTFFQSNRKKTDLHTLKQAKNPRTTALCGQMSE